MKPKNRRPRTIAITDAGVIGLLDRERPRYPGKTLTTIAALIIREWCITKPSQQPQPTPNPE